MSKVSDRGYIVVWLDAGEREEVARRAAREHLTVSQYIRWRELRTRAPLSRRQSRLECALSSLRLLAERLENLGYGMFGGLIKEDITEIEESVSLE